MKAVAIILLLLFSCQAWAQSKKSKSNQDSPSPSPTKANNQENLPEIHALFKLSQEVIEGGTPTFNANEDQTPWFMTAGFELGHPMFFLSYDYVAYKLTERLEQDRWRSLVHLNVLGDVPFMDLWLRFGAEEGIPHERIKGFNFNSLHWIYEASIGGGPRMIRGDLSYRVLDPMKSIETKVDQQKYRFNLRSYDRVALRVHGRFLFEILQPEVSYGVYRFAKSIFHTPQGSYEFTHPSFHFLNTAFFVKPPKIPVAIGVGYNQTIGDFDRYRLYINTGTRTLDYGHDTYFIQIKAGIDHSS